MVCFPLPGHLRWRPLCAHQHNLQNTHFSFSGLLQPSSQRIPVCHIRPASRSVLIDHSHVICSGLAHFPKYPEARQFPCPTGICLRTDGFSTYIRRSAFPQELHHPWEWSVAVPSCFCLQTFCSASRRPRLLEALLLGVRVTTRSSSVPRMCLLCLLTLWFLSSLVWPFQLFLLLLRPRISSSVSTGYLVTPCFPGLSTFFSNICLPGQSVLWGLSLHLYSYLHQKNPPPNSPRPQAWRPLFTRAQVKPNLRLCFHSWQPEQCYWKSFNRTISFHTHSPYLTTAYLPILSGKASTHSWLVLLSSKSLCL